ncbi:Hypothetical predicted protein [Octopus vulgaris]|uniref:Uncharacterized protein n=1 Tax=Octopus vulgaris TaxID=6645 RepID=A0AA36FC87_OCTVU|nr:Hypothetical predicted protein [Octopus vulgaris]
MFAEIGERSDKEMKNYNYGKKTLSAFSCMASGNKSYISETMIMKMKNKLKTSHKREAGIMFKYTRDRKWKPKFENSSTGRIKQLYVTK